MLTLLTGDVLLDAFLNIFFLGPFIVFCGLSIIVILGGIAIAAYDQALHLDKWLARHYAARAPVKPASPLETESVAAQARRQLSEAQWKVLARRLGSVAHLARPDDAQSSHAWNCDGVISLCSDAAERDNPQPMALFHENRASLQALGFQVSACGLWATHAEDKQQLLG